MLTLALLEGPAAAKTGPDMTQYFGVCVGLILLVVLGGYAFKRLFAHTLSTRAARRSLQIVDVLPLGGKQRLAVVRCYERTFVVGLGDKEMCLVTELDAQSTPELVASSVEPLPTPADQSAFQRLLRAARPRPPRKAVTLAEDGVLG
ncbi:MAG: flagellar biosynthetic protein FliO [Planctomycetota bacterium]